MLFYTFLGNEPLGSLFPLREIMMKHQIFKLFYAKKPPVFLTNKGLQLVQLQQNILALFQTSSLCSLV